VSDGVPHDRCFDEVCFQPFRPRAFHRVEECVRPALKLRLREFVERLLESLVLLHLDPEVAGRVERTRNLSCVPLDEAERVVKKHGEEQVLVGKRREVLLCVDRVLSAVPPIPPEVDFVVLCQNPTEAVHFAQQRDLGAPNESRHPAPFVPDRGAGERRGCRRVAGHGTSVGPRVR
jgi:hypothetical protein